MPKCDQHWECVYTRTQRYAKELQRQELEREKRQRREGDRRRQEAHSSSGDGLGEFEDGTENDLVRLTFLFEKKCCSRWSRLLCLS